jgi:hypothetical protein
MNLEISTIYHAARHFRLLQVLYAISRGLANPIATSGSHPQQGSS